MQEYGKTRDAEYAGTDKKAAVFLCYSEDLSEKMKTSLKTIRGNGNYVAAYASYGYVKSQEDKHQLVIDEVTSKIVKRIFKEYKAGGYMYKIARNLNDDGIVSLGIYIAEMEGNEQYTGTLVYNRYESKEVGARRCVTLPE